MPKLIARVLIIENISAVPNMKTILFLERNFIITRMKLISSDIFKLLTGYFYTVSNRSWTLCLAVVRSKYIMRTEINKFNSKNQ